MNKTAVVMLGFGAPESLDDVGRFMKNLTGRDIPDDRLEAIKDKYRAIGGGSPLTSIARRQAKALEDKLEQFGYQLPVMIGMCYMEPFIDEVIRELAQSGYKTIIGVSLSPQNSRVTTGAYLERFRDAAKANGCEAIEVLDWPKNSNYLKALYSSIARAIEAAGSDSWVLFSAHSVPKEHIDTGDTYLDEIKDTIAGLEEMSGGLDCSLSFQSKGGPGSWLEPSTDDELVNLAGRGVRNVVIVAISFISDHMENLYDIDIVYQKKAKELGLNLVRVESLNDSDGLVTAMAESVLAAISNQDSKP